MAKYLDNSASSGDKFNAKLEYVGDGTEADGADYIPLITEYPKNGTIQLDSSGDNKGTKRAITNFIPAQDEEYTIAFCDNIVFGTSYDIFVLNPKVDNTTADVWYGDQDNNLSLLAINTGLLYTRPTTAIILTKDRLALPIIPICVFGGIADITDTSAHIINLSFNTEPTGLVLTDFVYDTSSGTLSGLAATANPKEWVVYYTANSVYNQDETITLPAGSYTDQYGNASTADAVSEVFNVSVPPASVEYAMDVFNVSVPPASVEYAMDVFNIQ